MVFSVFVCVPSSDAHPLQRLACNYVDDAKQCETQLKFNRVFVQLLSPCYRSENSPYTLVNGLDVLAFLFFEAIANRCFVLDVMSVEYPL